MNLKPALLALCWLGVAALAVPSLRADDDKIRTDVVMDLSPQGKKLPIPTAERPTIYLPLPVGYVERGPPENHYQRPVPPPAKIERLVALMLAEQHYLVMTKFAPPNIALVIKWGYKAPEAVRMDTDDNAGTAMNNFGSFGKGNISAGLVALRSFTTIDTNDTEMNELVAGTLVNLTDNSIKTGLGAANYRDKSLFQMAHEPRWYIEITAIDLNDWAKHKVTLLWREVVSTELWGHYLDEVLPTLITAGGPYIGRPMDRPMVATEPVNLPPGWVNVGKPVVVPSTGK